MTHEHQTGPSPDGDPGRSVGRRDVLRWMVAGGLSTSLVGSLAVVACSDDDTGSGGRPATTPAGRAIERIGRSYRAQHPDEDDVEVLLAAIGITTDELGSADDLASLDARVEEDYERGRTTLLDGWVLSVTEGRAAALLSLT